MKRTISVLLLLSITCLAFAQQPADTIRVLCIGNSFSVNAVNRNIGEIAEADGKTIVVGNLYIGGCTLATHHDNMKSGKNAYLYYKRIGSKALTSRPDTSLEYGIDDEKWDVVTLQQCSGLSGRWETYEPYLSGLVEYVSSKCPQAKLMWHQTWSYSNDATHPDFPYYGMSSSEMFKAIAETSRKAVEKYNFTVIPCGAAIQTLRSSYLGPSITADGYHLNTFVGEYTAAATFYATICGHDYVPSDYRPALMWPEVHEIANAAVGLAIDHPYEISWLKDYSSYTFRKACVNQDEEKVPQYTLPDPLVANDGSRIRNKKQWMKKRRQEILDMFCEYEYGYVPGKPDYLKFEKMTEDANALGGLATRREIRVRYADNPNACFIVLEYVPNGVEGKVPAFLVPVFYGNFAVSDDPGISLYSRADLNRIGICPYTAERGCQKSRYPIETILSKGYAFVAVYYADISTDAETGWARGPFRFFYKKGQYHPADNEWGSISAWAWGLSRCLDYLETDEDVDATRVAVTGHSRLGKTALWAAALDQRFAMSISNCSGCCGAAIARRKIGENFMTITADFPHWFCRNFYQFRGREDEFPVDQHELIALIAPRPVYVASGDEDLWADPKGEKLAFDEAAKVYKLFGKKAVAKMGYHLRKGPHALTYEDWDKFLDFADKNL